MHRHSFRLIAMALALLVAATACQNGESTAGSATSSAPRSNTTQSDNTTQPATTEAAVESTATTTPPGFNDHTVPSLGSVEDFDGLARSEAAQAAVKFAIPDLSTPGVRWMDSSFYEYHDEWYWFRLINGEPVPGLDTVPADVAPPGGFQTIDEVYAWASTRRDDLPLDLDFANDGSRLYSNEYYDLALRDPEKTYGLGTLVRYATDDGPRWVFELEFSEATTPDSIAQFFDRLAEALPAEIGEQLEWVARSPEQAITADAMRADGRRYGDQIVRYADLVPQGEVAVYNPGLTAGRLRLISTDSDLNAAKDTDILVMENVPDWLPPAAAILTSAPQTPLAHVNLLARNRGIPNVSISGLLDDPAVNSAARVRSYAVVSASADGDLQITLIDKAQFDAWNDLRQPTTIAVPAVDLSSTATTLSLTELAATTQTEAAVAALRPVIGGKSAGFLSLLAAEGVTTPDTPVAITVAPYFRHLALVRAELTAMLADRDFGAQARIRFLLLEGGDDYAATYTSETDKNEAAEFEAKHPNGPIRTILDADGFVNLFRDTAMATADLDQITSDLDDTFAPLSVLQGLRFRSSSSVEDIEGFSGAGLYDSNTGFFTPVFQADQGDHKKTIERTIKKTWASYWSFEAFEERRLENVDHRSGGMGVLVHPRFDDALEDNNGVATLMLMPEDSDLSAVLTINAQAGDVSVANPEAGSDVLPEQILVTVTDDGEPTIARMGASTLVADDEVVLSDDAVLDLLGQLTSVARLWRDRLNADLDPAQQVDIVTLDFEFKHMAAGWPSMANSTERPARLVVKQARSLDPDLRGMPADVLSLPIPRDVLARAILVEQVTCPDGEGGVDVTTSAAAAADALPSQLRFTDAQTDLDDDACEREVLFSSPEQLLIELLESGEGLALN